MRLLPGLRHDRAVHDVELRPTALSQTPSLDLRKGDHGGERTRGGKEGKEKVRKRNMDGVGLWYLQKLLWAPPMH